MDTYLRNAFDKLQDHNDEARHQAMLDAVAEKKLDSAILAFVEVCERLTLAELIRNFIAPDEADQLDVGETLLDRLTGSLRATVDADGDDELSDEMADELAHFINSASELLHTLGVSPTDADRMLLERDQEAGERVHELLTTNVDLATFDDMLAPVCFAPLLDEEVDAQLDAVNRYKGNARGRTWARKFHGRRTINSRHNRQKITTHLKKHKPWAKRYSTKQRMALTKARTRAQSNMAKNWRRKSYNRTMLKLGGRQVR